MKISDELILIMACPSCKSDIKQEGDWIICLNAVCGLRFPIRNGIPVMLVEEAQKFS